MKIIIVGLGQKGVMLADTLAKEWHDVVVVDTNREIIEKVTNEISVSGICGNGVSKSVLLQAGADTADVIIALTPSDEVNMMICMVAKNCGTRYAGARLYSPEISDDVEYLAKEFKVDYVINPRQETAAEIARQIGFPGSVRADAFFSKHATLIRVPMAKGLFPASVQNVQNVKEYLDVELLVATVIRKNEIFIPRGDFKLQKEDILGIIATDANINIIIQKLGLKKDIVKKAFVVGGGDVCYYLGKKLLEQKISVSVMENDRKRCMALAEKLPDLKVSCADGLKAEVLLEEGLENADACISLTGSDENNLVVSLFAWSCGINSIVTKVNSTEYERLLNRVNMDITISPNIITVDGMLGFVRNVAVYNAEGNDIESMHLLNGGLAEAIEFKVFDNCKYKGIPLKSPDFKLKKDIQIAMIIRGEDCFIPNGNSTIESGDRVVVITKHHQKLVLNHINDIFKDSLF